MEDITYINNTKSRINKGRRIIAVGRRTIERYKRWHRCSREMANGTDKSYRKLTKTDDFMEDTTYINNGKSGIQKSVDGNRHDV